MNYSSRASSDLLVKALRPNTVYGGEYDPRENDMIDNDLYQIKCNVTAKRYEQVEENFRDNFNYEEFKKDCSSHWREVFQAFVSVIQKTIPSLKVDKTILGSFIQSPATYNYGGDWINFTYEVDHNELINYVEKLDKDIFDQFIYKNYSSYDGFISFTPNSIGGIIAALKGDQEDRDFEMSIFAVLNYIMQQEDNREEFLDLEDDIHLYEYIGDSLTYCKDPKYVRMARKFLS